MSPYFLDAAQMAAVIGQELRPGLSAGHFDAVYFYGTGAKNPANAKLIRTVLRQAFPGAEVAVTHDLLGAARALCGREAGLACILGTGSNSCYFDGRRIVRNSPGIGYVLGDEGSGAYLGKKLVQHYLYGILEPDLKKKFERLPGVSAEEILTNVYRKPLPNRYLAAFTTFLSANRGHYMVENIVEDGLNDFFFTHLLRYPQVQRYPVHFTGAIAWYFKDVVASLCADYGVTLGTVLKAPMEGLVRYHRA